MKGSGTNVRILLEALFVMATIEFHNVEHEYVPGTSALRLPELVFEDGGAYALLGPSGCGKSTTLNLVSGLLRPTRGSITFDGSDVRELDPRERNVAQMFQFPVVYDTMTVYDNLAFPLRNRRVPRAEIERTVRETAELLELERLLSERAASLGADGKQLVSLGRGLVRRDTAAMLLDEPLTVIDPERRWVLRRTLKRAVERYRITMIYVTHDQMEALTFADEIFVMNAGEVLQRGDAGSLFERPAHEFVGRFIGSPGMNFFPCTLEGATAVLAGGLRLPLRNPNVPGDGEWTVGIRPEFLEIVLDAGDARPHLPATVVDVEHHGAYRLLHTELGPQKLECIVRWNDTAADVPPSGTEIRVRFPEERLSFFPVSV